jgi:hypothetical protein
MSEEVTANWYDSQPCQRGAQLVYSDTCIMFMLMIKAVFNLPYRQTQGFASGLLKLMGLEGLKVPCYTQINRRAGKIDVSPHQIPRKGPIVLVIDSTGLKVFGEGEWKVRKHGYSKRRTWRKLHLAVDPDQGFVHSFTLTKCDKADPHELETLLGEVEGTVSEVCCDGAYDTSACWDSLIAREIKPIIPPQKNARCWYHKEPGDLPDYPRNKAIERITEVGRAQWEKEIGYHRRSLAETAMFRIKTIFGGQFYSRLFGQQQNEMAIKIKVLNLMTAQGMPVSQAIQVS